jgi:hypothetical protein
MMHVEKLRPAIGLHAFEAGTPTRLAGTSACHYPGIWRATTATIANNLPVMEQRCNSLPAVRMPRDDVARDRRFSLPTILEDKRNIPVVEVDLVAFAANVC